MSTDASDQYNIDLASRQIQINEWSYNNKMDTLFVFQILFMSILFVSILMALKTTGMIGGAFIWYSMAIVIFIVVIIIINRSLYTQNRRDLRLWNKRRFDGDNTLESPLGRGDPSYQSYLASVRAKYGSTSSCNCNSA
jgi:hypothetical protein